MARAMAESSSAAPEGEEAEEESGLRNAVDAVPYMLHVLVVFVITWLFLPITFYGFIIFCLFIIHLVQVRRCTPRPACSSPVSMPFHSSLGHNVVRPWHDRKDALSTFPLIPIFYLIFDFTALVSWCEIWN